MLIRPAAIALIGILACFPGTLGAGAQDPQSRPEGQTPEPVKPPAPAPEQAPPPPPAQVPEPPTTQPPAATKDLPSGQWVHTDQYGWVWMPYGKSYTHVPTEGETPYMYVYYPADGWCWVIAPWVWGWGPQPYFGVAGPWGYGWWGNGFGMWYGFTGRYAYWGYGGSGIYGHRGWYYPPYGGTGGQGGSRPLSPPWRGTPGYGSAPRGGASYGSGPSGGPARGGAPMGGGGVRR